MFLCDAFRIGIMVAGSLYNASIVGSKPPFKKLIGEQMGGKFEVNQMCCVVCTMRD